jgi:hypothetical protein
LVNIFFALIYKGHRKGHRPHPLIQASLPFFILAIGSPVFAVKIVRAIRPGTGFLNAVCGPDLKGNLTLGIPKYIKLTYPFAYSGKGKEDCLI